MTDKTAEILDNNSEHSTQLFTFGDPEPVLDGVVSDFITEMVMDNGTYYESPVDLKGIAKLLDATPYHGSILYFKKDLLVKWFQPSALLSRSEFEYIALDFVVFGQCYLQAFRNRLGRVTRLAHQPRKTMRKMKGENRFLKLTNNLAAPIVYQEGEILEVKEPDVNQKIYGRPVYLGGVQSVLLGAEATLFRRRWYLNGAHMGFILVANDANLGVDAAKAIETKLKESKGIGNGRNMFINIPRSPSREPIKVIPIGDIGSKDDIEKIKSLTKDEALAMHRMPPELAGVIPSNTGGFGDPEKKLRVYHELEVESLQNKFLELNQLVGGEAVAFVKPDWTLGN